MVKNNHSRISTGAYVWQVRVRSEAHLDDWLKDYFGELNMSHEKDGSTLLTGELPDMSAVYGLILQLRDTGIVLISLQVERKP